MFYLKIFQQNVCKVELSDSEEDKSSTLLLHPQRKILPNSVRPPTGSLLVLQSWIKPDSHRMAEIPDLDHQQQPIDSALAQGPSSQTNL